MARQPMRKTDVEVLEAMERGIRGGAGRTGGAVALIAVGLDTTLPAASGASACEQAHAVAYKDSMRPLRILYFTAGQPTGAFAVREACSARRSTRRARDDFPSMA